MSRVSLRSTLVLCLLPFFFGLAAASVLSPESNRVVADLIEQVAGSDLAAAYRDLPADDKPAYLDRFWRSENPVFHKYYIAPSLGQRRYTVSDRYFERMAAVPELFKRHIDRPDSAALAEARTLTATLVEALPGDAGALCARGYVLLEAGEIEEADAAFLEALKLDRKHPEARNGRGLAQLALGKRAVKAMEELRAAAVLDDSYAAAHYNLAMANLVIRSREVGRWFETVIEKFPDHPDAYFKLGAYHEIGLELEKEPNLAEAAEAYRKQIDVNPDHGKAWFQRGSVLLKLGRAEDAVALWERLMAERPGFRQRYLTQLIEAYQQAGKARLAEATAAEYIASLDAESQALFKDLSLIATAAERAEYEALDRWDKLSFARKFWQKRDPTPATDANERRVEHYRRVIYAMQNFSDARQPWDTRGDVYIRYGEPAHKSRWDDMRFEFDRDVVRVKERLLNRLPGSAKREVIARSRRIRQSIRDREPGELEIGDFGNVEFELNASRRRETSNEITEGESYGAGSFTSLERIGEEENIRGLPLYPVEPGRPWEYWIFPYVNGGIEVVFESLTLDGDFGYPSPPQGGRGESSRNAIVWEQQRPENTVASAVARTGETYFSSAPPILLATQAAVFMGNGRQSRLELYFGTPLDPMAVTLPDTGRMSRGIAVFSLDWKPLYRKSDTLRYVRDPEKPGQIAVSEWALSLPPGDYVIGSQVGDAAGRAFGARYDTVTVDAYAPGAFAISDLELASAIFEDYREALKDGLSVIPNPTGVYLKTRPVTVYYEVYGLTKDDFGQSRYQVTYRIAPAEHEGKFLGKVLRSIGRVMGNEQEETVTITTEQVGYRTEQSEYIEIDVTAAGAGRYDLDVTVTDLVTGAAATKSAAFTLHDAPE